MPDNDSNIFGMDDFNMEEDDGYIDGFGMGSGDSGGIDIGDGLGGTSEYSLGESEFDLDDIAGEYETGGAGNHDKKSIVKTSLMSIGIGLALILIAFGINSLVTSSGKKDVTNKKEVVDRVENDITYRVGKNEWTQFNLSENIEFGDSVDSAFTVVEIRHYALVNNKSNDKQLKSLVRGNISSLVGDYEIEIPFDKAQELSVGAVFSISYKIVKLGDYSVVSGIEF